MIEKICYNFDWKSLAILSLIFNVFFIIVILIINKAVGDKDIVKNQLKRLNKNERTRQKSNY